MLPRHSVAMFTMLACAFAASASKIGLAPFHKGGLGIKLLLCCQNSEVALHGAKTLYCCGRILIKCFNTQQRY